ncbi:hypothetical protein, partial [Acidiferrobacter sp.]|uniref:hypothetical protein n=1 Tax=Acidiferrobacter sp. TaxID=1872107 RepID=UPI0026085F9E
GHRKTRKKMQAVELEPYAYLNIGLRGPAVVFVSFIVFADQPHKFENLFSGTPAQVAAKWRYVVVNANAYKYAEHGSPPDWGASFEFWPNSLYQLPPGGNNSNTFAEATVKASGIPWRGLPGSHPGNNAPRPVHTRINKFDLVRG